MRARDFLKYSPLFDTLEIVKVHDHRCSVCHQLFACSKLGCTIDDRYAVCPKVACVQEWEGPGRQDWDEDAEHCNAADEEAAKINAAMDAEDDASIAGWDAEDLRSGEPSR